MYAAELGVDPQADFTNRPESQGQLGSAVSCFPSGASRVLDRHTYLEGYWLYISAEKKLHRSKILTKIGPHSGWCTTSEAVRHKARALVAGSLEGISGIKLG